MAISPTSPAPCQGPKGSLHCLVHHPHSPAKLTPLWDQSTVFHLPGLRSSHPFSGCTPHTCCPYLCNYNGAETHCGTEIRHLCHSRALQHVCPCGHPVLGHPQFRPCFLQPGLSAELQDLQASHCCRIPARLPERSRSWTSMTLYTFRSPSALIFPGSLSQPSPSVYYSSPRTVLCLQCSVV